MDGDGSYNGKEDEESVSKELQDIEKRFDSIEAAVVDCNGAREKAVLFDNIWVALRQTFIAQFKGLFPNGMDYLLPEDRFLVIMKFLIETLNRTCPTGSWATLENREQCVMDLLRKLVYIRDMAPYSAAFLEYVLKWLEDRWVTVSSTILKFDSLLPFSPERVKAASFKTFINILNKLLVCDKERSQETRIVKLILTTAHKVPESNVVMGLAKVAEHYTTCPEVGRQEEFMQNFNKRITFLEACRNADVAASFSRDVNSALDQTKVYGERAKYWAGKEKTLQTMASSCKFANTLSIDFPVTARLKTATHCLDRLDFANNMSADLNPYKSNTLASVMDTVMSPELITLNALKEETELHSEVVRQVEKINERHLQAYEVVKKQQYEILDEIFQACQKEKEDVVKEALYKKAKYLASIEKASHSSAGKLSSEDVLKRIVQKAGGALKRVEGKLEARSLEKPVNSECALCYAKFSKKRKRACLDPCGHASVCFSCATKAWEKKPNCPVCRAAIEKPIPLPAQLFL